MSDKVIAVFTPEYADMSGVTLTAWKGLGDDTIMLLGSRRLLAGFPDAVRTGNTTYNFEYKKKVGAGEDGREIWEAQYL